MNGASWQAAFCAMSLIAAGSIEPGGFPAVPVVGTLGFLLVLMRVAEQFKKDLVTKDQLSVAILESEKRTHAAIQDAIKNCQTVAHPQKGASR